MAKKLLRLACIDSAALPLFDLSREDGKIREGFEPELACAVAAEMDREVEWVFMPWDNMIPSVQNGDTDAVWCGQGIIPSRLEQVDFTRPYAIFNESVLVRAGDPARSPDDLRGYRVAAIEGSANMRLAETFPDVTLVPFASSDDVFQDMIEAVRNRTVDAMVDDDVVTVPLGDDPDFELAFTAQTNNPWGAGVAKSNPTLRDEISAGISACIENGKAEQLWKKWFPALSFPRKELESHK